MSDLNTDFHVFQLAEMPVLSALHRDLPEEEMLSNMTMVPGEQHCAVTYFETEGDKEKMVLLYHGGIMHESVTRSKSCSKVYKTSFLIENGALAMVSDDSESSVVAYHSTEPHLKQQKTPKKYLMHGSKLEQLSGSAMVKFKDNVFIFGGFNSDIDSNVDDIYILKNLVIQNAEQTLEVILCPGKLKIEQVIGEQRQKLMEYPYTQTGDVPGARSGHQCFVVGDEILLIGGHLLEEQKLCPGKEMRMPDHPVYSFNPETIQWKVLSIRENNNLFHLLNRSNFGAVQIEDKIWITGRHVSDV